MSVPTEIHNFSDEGTHCFTELFNRRDTHNEDVFHKQIKNEKNTYVLRNKLDEIDVVFQKDKR